MRESQPQLTSQQRLKQIEILLATAAKTINELSNRQALNSEAITCNSEAIAHLRITAAQTLELFTEMYDV